jgi:hypothetical protein
MRHNRLKLIVAENSEKTASDSTTDSVVVPARLDFGPRRLHLMDADEGPFPDDAA